MTDSEALPNFNLNNYLDHDFVNFNIISSSKKLFGTVLRVLGSKTTLLLEVSYNDKTYLVPINSSFIVLIDLKEKNIMVNNIEEISNLWYLIF